MWRAARYALVGVVLVLLIAAGVGTLIGGGILHPQRKALAPEHVHRAGQAFARIGAAREDIEVRAADGAVLRGWKVRPAPDGSSVSIAGSQAQAEGSDWVLLFHGVSDNRMGVIGHAEILLRNGYSVVMMDARAHGASDGSLATYGWKERQDTQAIVNALMASERVHCLFALGESMGAALALQSAAVEPRITGVVAESSFSDLREVSYDYAGLRVSAWLGKTLFRPASWMAIRTAGKEGGFRAEDVSPEKAVASRGFPVLLICGMRDRNIPARHSERLYAAARGVKELWLVPGAGHSSALGTAPAEFEQRVVTFLKHVHATGTPRELPEDEEN
ncbi:MAG TPA: alpha/beta fold hydrolase [Candidatus Acidoferrales bacterium]|nr:alpha/beta fold hydrolase [Candidatus Acidoferrales bacterium]